jgi:NADH-quinone oxidoreductase subunit H
MRFSFFAMAEYAEMFLVSAVAVVLWFGGFHLPFEGRLALFSFLPAVALKFFHLGAFLAKVWLLIILMMWIRWTLPRYRIDQMMDLCWKALLPLAFLNFLGTACWMVFVG